MNRRIPEALHFLVKHRYRRRTTGHIERGDKIADQRSRNDDTGRLEQFADSIVHQIELRKRRCSKAVDQENSLTPRALAEVGRDGVGHLCGDVGGGLELYAAASWLAVDPDADLHLVFGDVES